jgi:deoxyhypusine monooxygenase
LQQAAALQSHNCPLARSTTSQQPLLPQDACPEVAHTCQLALQRIEHFAAAAAAQQAAAEADSNAAESRYYSVDPTPAAPASTPLPQLRESLLDEQEAIFQRYRAMFALRNRGGGEAVEALGASFAACASALLKHEVAYVLGQMQDAQAVQMLK